MEEKDAHLYAELSKRKRALLTLDWDVLPPRNGGARKQAAEVRDWLWAVPDFEDVLLNLANGLLYGYAALELEWRHEGGLWFPTPHYRPPGWFQLDPETRTELRLRSSTYQGEPLRPLGWIIHRHQAKSGYLARAGLVRILAWPYLFKNYAVRDLAELLELHGIPLRLATYPTFLGETDKTALWTQLRDLGHNAAALLPEGVKVEFAEIQSKGEPYQAMMDWCERSISKAILGQTLSAESKATGLGSGVANLHDEVRWDLISSDARQIAGTLTTQLIGPLLRLNRGVEDQSRLPRFAFDLQDVVDLSQYAEALPKLVSIGLPIPVAWASERLGIPAPANGEPVLTAAAPAQKPETEEQPEETAPARRAVLTAAAPIDPTTPLVDRLGAESDPLIDALLEPVRALLELSPDLEAFREGLLTLYPDLDPTAFAALMAQALAVADAAGRLEARGDGG
jgi:phage gp29-like protein